MEKETRTVNVKNLEVRDADGKRKIVGYAAVFDRFSEDLGGFREKIAPGAFRKSLKKSDVRALYNHDANFILGRTAAGTLKLKEDDSGLWMEIDPPDTQYARDLLVSIERGDINQQSFGFTVKSDTWDNLEGKGLAERTLNEIEQLFDVSPVTYPAYPDTTVALRGLDKAKADVVVPENGDDDGENAEPALPGKELVEMRQSCLDRVKGMKQRLNEGILN